MLNPNFDRKNEAHLRQVRRLVSSDRKAFLEILVDHFESLERKGVNTKIYTSSIEEYLGHDSDKMAIFGYFGDQNQLLSTVAYRAWPSLPYATLSYMVTRKQGGIFNSQNNGLVYCTHKCFQACDTLGIRAFYHLQRANTFLSKSRTWRKFDTELTQKYYSVPELIIEAGERPTYTIAWELMDQQVWPYKTILWLTRVKPNYEKIINWGE